MKRWLALEVAFLAACAVLAWWIGAHGTTAWLARVERLKLSMPGSGEQAVRGAAHMATSVLILGIAILGVARVVGARRAGASPIAVPWLIPAAVAATLLGFAVHLSTVEISHGAAVMPTASGFAQGFLVGAIAGAIVLVVPVDLAELASRYRTPIALAILAIFVALAVAGSGPAGSGTRINLGPLQPIELVKPLAVVFLGAYFGARAPKLRWHRQRFLGLRWPRVDLLLPAIGVLVMIVLGLRLVGDLGPVLLLAFVFLGMFFLASRATGWVVVALGIIALVLIVLAFAPGLAGHGTVKTRLVMWRDPWHNGLSNGHQLGEG
ncbi:MAG TPA: FtsW/RodA/SpoVE family cell cycle protein, partial [Kofleriaceae bacterium]|nr:FtsW/RodA/SpoVE family cell cycle protein [Kofleriaceae bacterium]